MQLLTNPKLQKAMRATPQISLLDMKRWGKQRTQSHSCPQQRNSCLTFKSYWDSTWLTAAKYLFILDCQGEICRKWSTTIWRPITVLNVQDMSNRLGCLADCLYLSWVALVVAQCPCSTWLGDTESASWNRKIQTIKELRIRCTWIPPSSKERYEKKGFLKDTDKKCDNGR